MRDRSPTRLADDNNYSNLGFSPSTVDGANNISPPTNVSRSNNKKKQHRHEHQSNDPYQKRNYDQHENSIRQPTTTIFVNRLHDERQSIDQNHQPRPSSPSEFSTKSAQLKYGAKSVIDLFIPVSICIWIVVATIKATDRYHYSSQTVIWYAKVMFTDQTVNTSTRVWQSLANALVMLLIIIIMTSLLIVLYKFECYKIIYTWLMISSLMLLFAFMMMYVSVFLKVYNIPMDYLTLGVFIWNFGVLGMVCIHWKGPLLLQQAYLIMISALMALVFIQCLPDWTVWTVLIIVSVWDLVAVLCPRGPLRILVETAEERNEPIFPALIYSSTMLWELPNYMLPLQILTMTNDNRGRRRSSSGQSAAVPTTVTRGIIDARHDIRLTSSSSSGMSSPRRNNSNNFNGRFAQKITSSPRKMRSDNLPLEIQYDDGAQTPKITVIKTTLPDEYEWQQARVEVRQKKVKRRLVEEQETSMRLPNATGDPPKHSVADDPFNSRPIRQPVTEQQDTNQNDEERGVKLGLGDFIFFSVLVGKVSSYSDWTITISCYVSVLLGLCLTLSLLTIFRKALPALPISIAFGLCSFFASYSFVVPFAAELAINQVFL